MPVSWDANRIVVDGFLSPHDGMRVLSGFHNIVHARGYQDITLDFTSCTNAFAPQMLAICAHAQALWKAGIDVSLIPPTDVKFGRLFVNTNWAHLIDFRGHPESRFRGYTHAPALRFSNATDQTRAVNKLMDVLLAALRDFRRDDIRAIEWVLNELTVRHQSFRDSERRHLREALAPLVSDVMRLADDAASAGLRWSVV